MYEKSTEVRQIVVIKGGWRFFPLNCVFIIMCVAAVLVAAQKDSCSMRKLDIFRSYSSLCVHWTNPINHLEVIGWQVFGFFQVPYLEDPNTGVQMFESAEIVEYLRTTYVVWEAEKSSVAWGICFLCSCKVSQFDIILHYFSYDWYTWSHAVWEIQMLEQLENNRISNYLRALVPCGNTFQVILQRLLYVLVSIYLIIFKDAISLSLQCTEETNRYSSRLDDMKRDRDVAI